MNLNKKIISIFLLLFFCALSVHSKQVELKSFFKPPSFTYAKLSPDGNNILVSIRENGTKRLAVVSLKDKKVLNSFDFGGGEKTIGPFGWLSNDRIFVQLVREVGPLAEPRLTGYLYASNIDGSERQQLLPKVSAKSSENEFLYQIVSLKKSDKENILIQKYTNKGMPIVEELNVYNGKRVQVETGPVKYNRSSPSSTTFIAYQGEVKVARVDKHNEEKKILFYKSATGWKEIDTINSKQGDLSLVGFSGGDNSFYVESIGLGQTNGIYKYDINKKKPILVHEIIGDAEVSDYIYDNQWVAPEVIGFKRMKDYPSEEFFDKKHPIAKMFFGIAGYLKDQMINIIDYTKDGRKALIFASSDMNPGQYYLFDLNKNKIEFLFSTRPWLNVTDMSMMQPISFTARDGLNIRGYLTTPKNQKKNLPLVLLVHGGPFGVSDKWEFNEEVQFLANRGYAVLQVNFRGSGGRSKSFQYDAYKKVGREMQYDLTDATHWAINQGVADKDRICIYGGSYGGYAALMAVTQEPDLYKCAIGYVGLYDINLTSESDIATRESGRNFLSEAWGVGDEQFVKERSPINHLENIKAALFIVHGEEDKRVPVSNFYHLTQSLDEKNYPYESLLKEHEGHGFYNESNRYELYTKLEEFLDKHIGK